MIARLLDDPRSRFPLLALGMLALVAGLTGGVQRIGWTALPARPDFAVAHGPLMVCGFLGTLISLERAVALGKTWAYLGPFCTGLGAILMVTGIGPVPAAALIATGSLVLIAVFVRVLQIQAAPFAIVMATGAVSWFVGNVLWLIGWPVFDVVAWWMGFLILTIAGERLELSRMLLHRPGVQSAFLGIMCVLVGALILTTLSPDPGMRLAGVALIPLSIWLMRYDVARHTIRQQGLTRFIAACLLAGYVWLIVAGILMITHGAEIGGTAYDAMLHAVFVGFVFSMIFGHAPIIFPSVLGVPVAYRPIFYLHLVLLHVSLVVRVIGDTAGLHAIRQIGGVMNAAAVLVFLGATIGSVALERRRHRSLVQDGWTET